MNTTNKKSILVIGPFGTASGYGARARDIAYALLENPDYDIKLLNTRWGNTPQNFLDDSNENHRLLLSKMIFNLEPNYRPDISFQITIPSEFQRVGTYSIGVTAGIETTVAPSNFIEGCNRIDLTLFSSKFSETIVKNTVYSIQDQQGNTLPQKLQVTTKTDVLFEGVNTEIYNKNSTYTDLELENYLNSNLTSFTYLTVGHWLHGEFNQDRKNISGTIWSYINAFKNKINSPTLLLKISGGNYSELDKERILTKIESIKNSFKDVKIFPKIVLLHGHLTDQQMNLLYNHERVKAFILLTKGEGYGRPIAEFATTGKPIIVSNYSGMLDFLPKDLTCYVPGTLTQVHKSAVDGNLILENSSWFSADLESASKLIRMMFESYGSYHERSRKLPKHIKDNFSYEKMKDRIYTIINEIPTFKKIILPTLKKIS